MISEDASEGADFLHRNQSQARAYYLPGWQVQLRGTHTAKRDFEDSLKVNIINGFKRHDPVREGRRPARRRRSSSTFANFKVVLPRSVDPSLALRREQLVCRDVDDAMDMLCLSSSDSI